MGFAGADRSSQDDVLAMLQILAAAELLDLLFGDPLESLPVDLAERLDLGEPSFDQAPLGRAIVPGSELRLEKLLEETLEAPGVVASLASSTRYPSLVCV